MVHREHVTAQSKLKESVLDAGLCTGCGACNENCPYFEYYKDNAVILHRCDLEEGRCYAHCPRTPTDLEALRRSLFDPADLTPELGPFKGIYLTRSTDEGLRAGAQHGGTVSTLVALALEEGVIDTAVVADEQGDFLAEGVEVRDPSKVVKGARSKFVVSPNVAAFNRAARGEARNVGVVATPCQALAYAKMRASPSPSHEADIGKLRLVIGLFCGWALSWKELRSLLVARVGDEPILGMEVPPSHYQRVEVYTAKGTVTIPLEEVLPCVRRNCEYCFDMTCEFSDLSVGSARSAEGWDVDRGWNQVIVRTRVGQELVDLARSRGRLEFRDVPEANREKLKRASLNKKRACVKSLIEKSGSSDDLVYLKRDDPVLGGLV